MASFYIVPPRKVNTLSSSGQLVTSINTLVGDVDITVGSYLDLSISGNNLTISIVPGSFLLKTGDTVLGNLNMNPPTGGYGLKLLATSVQPTQNALGAIYYDSGINTVWVYTTSGWQNILQISGAITQAQADARYLELNASNGPVTGDLSMGSALFRFGNKSSDPISASAGSSYFNTVSNSLRYYDGSAWQDFGTGGGGGGGPVDIAGGNGISVSPNPITGFGTVSLDLGYSPTWTGSHIFSNPITFASGQTFNITGLTIASQAAGDLIVYNGSNWTRYGIGTSGQVLQVVGGQPTWRDNVAGEIGTPTSSPTYADGFFNTWTSTTLTADALAEISQFLGDIAPAAGTSLSGLALTNVVTPTLYQARLSAGLNSSNWYQAGQVAGNLISTYHVGTTFQLATPSPSNAFQLGYLNSPSSYGNLLHKIYRQGTFTTPTTRNLTTLTTGLVSTINMLSFTVCNSIWRIAQARIEYTHGSTDDGYFGHALNHTVGGESATTGFWRDYNSSINPVPTFSLSPSASELTPVDKWLSGIIYYGRNSTFTVSFIAASGIFNSCYHPTRVAAITAVGMTTVNLQPGSAPNYNATYDKSGGNVVTVTLDIASQPSSSQMSSVIGVQLFKPISSSSVTNATLLRPISTYSDTHSTTTAEYFFAENQRLLNTETSTTAFQSPTNYSLQANFSTLTGYAQVRNGQLVYPIVTDYQSNPSPYNYTPTFSGSMEFHRYFSKSSASTGTIVFGTLTAANISPYGSGDVNVLIYLESDAKYFDLGVAVGIATGTRDGSTRSLAYGAQVSISGNQLNWSIGTYSTTYNSSRYRVIVVLRTNVQVISSMVSS